MAGLDSDRTYLTIISFNDSKLPDGKSGEYRKDNDWEYLVNGYHIEDAFPIDSEKFRLFLKKHIDLNDEHQVSAVRTHLTRIRDYQTLDFLDALYLGIRDSQQITTIIKQIH